MTTHESAPAQASPAEAATNAAALMVVGIGASAGGLKALQQFVEAVPEASGMAFVVILHLDPERASRMGELLQDRAVIPVAEVSGPTTVEADHIYVIPPGQDLAMRGPTISLRARGERADHAPVDLFFRTLAEACGPAATGVILSGTGADGTAGIRYIREAGGITVAQSPDEAEYDGMPVSAISTGLIDLVLPASRIPGELIRLHELPRLGDAPAMAPDAEANLAPIFATLRSRTGHDFSLYKRATVLRRLDRRLRFNNVSSLEEYEPLLQSSSAECQALLRDLLISVSSFFRDPNAYEALAALLPTLFEGKGPADSVRVWVVGCATGEEAYSVAILLAEHASTLADPPRLQVFATDIDEHGYAWARAGLYTSAAVAGIPAVRLERFFSRESGGYRVAKSLREMVLFAGHNVLNDPPFSRMDLITCRNLFIYLQPEAQQRVLETFRFASNPEGLLFLGASESIGDSGLFTPIASGNNRLFRRSASPDRVRPRQAAADPLRGAVPPVAGLPAAPEDAPRKQFSYGALHVRMLEQYAPASVVVNDRLDVVHLSAGAGRFLELRGGEPSHNILALARGDLRRVLRTALHHAFENGTPAMRRVNVDVGGTVQPVDVQVRGPLADGVAGHLALVVFEIDGAGSGASDPPVGKRRTVTARAMAELEEELRRTQDLLESASAAHDRTVAQLQMVNEELQSNNEEQRAATEELETGREEIQSINEELITINQEHQSTIEELKRTNADLQNLIESTEIGTIFLDRGMRIRRFTPTAATIFNFVASDQGRLLSDITHRLDYTDLVQDVAGVLATLERIEREVESDSGESYIVRINPYRSPDGGNEGAVLSLFDSTAQRRIRDALRDATTAAQSANLAKGTFLATLSHEFRTPLNGILGYADLLQLDVTLTDAQAQKVGRIKAGCRHLASMIDEILSFAKLDAGNEEVRSALVDARLVAQEAAALVEPTATAKGLGFILSLPTAAMRLVTDAAKARQILLNLCGNAVKYTEAGEVRLSLRNADGRVIFDISDTGIGIAPEDQPRVFERFWQVDGASTRAAGGMGIGLAAAREYARLLGGDVTVASRQGFGSTFHFWLPAEREDGNEPAGVR